MCLHTCNATLTFADLTDSEAVGKLLKEAGGDLSPPPSPIKKATKVQEVMEVKEQEEEKPSEPVSLDAQELTSISIDLEEFESSREPSRSLYVVIYIYVNCMNSSYKCHSPEQCVYVHSYMAAFCKSILNVAT